MQTSKDQPLIAPSDQVAFNLDAAADDDVIVLQLQDDTVLRLRVERSPYTRLALISQLIPGLLNPSFTHAARQSLLNSGSRRVEWLEGALGVTSLRGMSPEDIMSSLVRLLVAETVIYGSTRDEKPNIGSAVHIRVPTFNWSGSLEFGTDAVNYEFGSKVADISLSTLREELIRATAQMPL